MPGLVGVIGAGDPGARRGELAAMVRTMSHEPWYASGTHADERIGVWVGWVGRDAQSAEGAVAWNEDRSVGLVFCGEEFSDPEVLAGLQARGHACGPGVAGRLVHLYEERGLDFLRALNGWFCGLLLDLRAGTATLFTDRYGLGRVNVHEKAGALYFASEAAAILTVAPELRALDLRSLGEVFSCGCVLQNRTLFPGIGLLPGGSCWTCAPGRAPRKQTYFAPREWEEQEPLGADEYCERLQQTFSRVLPRYLDGGARVGMSLTGGFDGRMVMAWAKRPPGSLPCYTFGSRYRENGDVRIARRVAALCGQPHTQIVVDDRFLGEFPSLVEQAVVASDGTMDASGSVELFVNAIAREIAPVRLTGNYGSEILTGGVAFGPRAFREELLAPEFAPHVRAASATFAAERQGRRLSFIAFKQVPWHHYARLSVEQSQLALRSPYLDNDLVSLAFRAPAGLDTSREPCFRLIEAGDRRLARVPTDRGLLRRPIPVVTALRHRFEELTFKAEYAYDYGMPPGLVAVDRLLRRLHPERLFLGRHKFVHFRVWYRDRLGGFLKDYLLGSRARARPYVDGRVLERVVNDHVSGRRNYTLEIHRFLTCEIICRRLLGEA